MAGEWKLIARGFLVAATGAVALMLFIVAVSAGYVGRFAIAAVCMFFACCLAIAFRICLTPFLETLDRREEEISARLDSQRGERTPPVIIDN